MANILFVTNSISFGGAAKILCFVAESLHKRNHNVCIVNLKATKNVTTYERNVNVGIAVYTVESKGRSGQIAEIKKIAKEFSANVIIGFTGFPSFYASLVGKALRIPSIMSERGDPNRTNTTSIKSAIVNFIVNRCSGGVFQTDGARTFYGRGLQKRGTVIPNPIFIEGEVPERKGETREKTVVSVARLDNFQKRYDVMLDAFRLFSQKHPEYILKLYGKGNDEEIIRTWVKERGLDERVQFMGLTTQPMADIYRDGMFLITSDFEGISNSLLEAMAVGLPCVSTDHTPGGARLLITDHENGLLAPIGNAEALASAMCEFADDPQLAEKCGRNARDVANRFEPQKIIDMWEEYIKKIIAKTEEE